MRYIIYLGVIMSSILANNLNSLSLMSKNFENNQNIPIKYTCQGENISPNLYWSNVPENTKSFAIILEDPDAAKKVWTHWIIFNIDKEINNLQENFSANLMSSHIKQGKNDFENNRYDGSCPPENETHRYFFKLYALDTVLDLDSGVTKEQLLDAMKNHIITQAQLIGLYRKS